MKFPEPEFIPIPPDEMPRDPDGSAAGWTFRLLEHGGAEPDTMPECIEATDAEGRSAIYVAMDADKMPPEDRPQDPMNNGTDWSFITLDHDEFGTPHSIAVLDAEGRSAAYLPLMRHGTIGRWK
jgi:hypothetical protein